MLRRFSSSLGQRKAQDLATDFGMGWWANTFLLVKKIWGIQRYTTSWSKDPDIMTTNIKFQTTKSLDSAQIEMEHMSSQHIWDDSEALILADGKIDLVSNPHLSN